MCMINLKKTFENEDPRHTEAILDFFKFKKIRKQRRKNHCGSKI